MENVDLFFGQLIAAAARKSLTTTLVEILPPEEAMSMGSQRIDLAEHHLYGSSRLGVKSYPTGVPAATFQEWGYQMPATLQTFSFMKPWWWSGAGAYQATTSNSWQVSSLSNGYSAGFESGRLTGQKSYELTDHLGNVLVTLLDRKSYNSASGQWEAEVATVSDPYPFGMQMEGRSFSVNNASYRFGHNGTEKVDEIAGAGNHLNFEARGFDPRLGRFWAVDPYTSKFPWHSPYLFAGNNPIRSIDKNGEYEVPKDKMTEYFSEFPMIMTYLSTQIQADVMKSSRIVNAFQKIRSQDKNFNAKAYLSKVTAWGSGPKLIITSAPGDEPAAAGHYNLATDAIELSYYKMLDVEKVLKSNASKADKSAAFQKFYQTVIHETGHRPNYKDEDIGVGKSNRDPTLILYNPGAETGSQTENRIWGAPGMLPFGKPLDPSSFDLQTIFRPGVAEKVVENANSTEDGRKSLPTLPTKSK